MVVSLHQKQKQIDMKAIIKKTGLEVFIREDVKPHASNYGMICVSKQPTGMCTFSVNKEDIEIVK